MPIAKCPALFIILTLLFVGSVSSPAADGQSFAGSSTCAECHKGETQAWSHSDHGWALREPSPENVLGDFNGASYSHKGITSRIFTRNGGYFVETEAADGALHEFHVRYTVGVRPLQQYLVETDKGRLQVLDMAWDTGQRKWFHLYPDQNVGAGNGMHWSGSYKNWQARCAECHQTGFEKNFDVKQQAYNSHWAELTVSCESCHGPAAGHVAAARQSKTSAAPVTMPTMIKLGAGQQANELAVCGPCHARREAFAQDSPPVGGVFGDHYNLALLNNGLYFADGQQNDEVYILGSFLQSKMMAKGVTCSNCHEPHGGGLVAEGNAVCTQCHNPAGRSEFPSVKHAAYDTPTHHHHKSGSVAAQCVSCHMPERAYMKIDKRRDHFFRKPDPLQSKAAGSPDVCTGCHQDKSAGWAAARITGWFPNSDRSWQDRSPFIAFEKGDRSPHILEALAGYVRNLARPAIARATAIAQLRDSASPRLKEELLPLLQDESGLVRAAAAGLTRELQPPEKFSALKPLLTDPLRSVRQAAAVELAGIDSAGISPEDSAALDQALTQYRESRMANADMPESHMAIAGLALSMRNWQAAETAFNQAAALDPQLDSAWLMLARLRAALGDEQGAASYLSKGLGHQPQSIDLMFERAGFEQRGGNHQKAIDWYRRIVGLDAGRSDAWLAMASAALQIRDSATTLDAANRVLAIEPDNIDALVLASVAHYLRGEMDRARDNAARARQIAPAVRLPPEIEQLLGHQ